MRTAEREVTAFLVALLGSAIVALGEDSGTATTLPRPVVSSVGVSAAFLIVTRKCNDNGGLNSSAWQTCGAAVCTSPSCLGPTTEAAWSPRAGRWRYGVRVPVSTAIAGVAFNWGISRLPDVRAAQLLRLAPVIGLILAHLVRGEPPSLWQLVGKR